MKKAGCDRRALISGLGATAAAVALGSALPRAQAKAAFAPARHPEDAWLDERPGKHRVFIDSASADGASDALLYAGNLFTANKSGYGLDDADNAIVVCFRHLSAPFGLNDSMWAKYGKVLAASSHYTNPRGGEAPTTNPHEGGRNGIDALARRGVHFAVCELSTNRVASEIASAIGGQTDAVYKELLANGVPNGHFVAAGVVTTTRAQEYGYSLLVAG